MPYMTIEVWDALGSKRERVEVPGDVPAERITVKLIERLSFPRYDPTGGQLLSYKMHLQRTHTQLDGERTLEDAGVVDGDVVRLLPEIAAGKRGAPR